MFHNLTPKDLQNEEKFILLEKVNYMQFKPFILKSLRNKSTLLTIYGIIQLITLVIATVILISLIIQSVKTGTIIQTLKWYLLSIGCSFTLLIPVHELLHALAFWVLGKKDIGFGAQLKQFIFYAEANCQVLDKSEMTIVAFTPLIVIELLASIFITFIHTSPLFYFGLGIFLIHFLFCAGDIAIVAFFHHKDGIYSYDDRMEKCSYFYKKREHQY